MMTEFTHLLAAWTLFGAGCSAWMYMREALRQHRLAPVRARQRRR
jgi:hypothetical protein